MGIANFATALKQTFNQQNSFTENGAIGYKTSGSPLVDFNFKVSSYRGKEPSEIANDFEKVFDYNPMLAVKMMFFAGDIRQGMGERKVFNSCLQWLASEHTDYCNAVISLIPEYARWDYLIALFDTKCDKTAWDAFVSQLEKDNENCKQDKPVSLLAKWMPSVNASNKESNRLGKKIASRLGLKEREYRKMLSRLRKKIDVVEKKMSANNWNEIDYNGVPSKANIIYKNAFMKHDEDRRQKYLDALERNDGTAKINASVAFPYDIIASYMKVLRSYYDILADQTLEGMWKALPDYSKDVDTGNTICVVDGSGSMGCSIGNTSITAHDVARSLGIYFSERLDGPFKDKFITFSSEPKLVDLSNCKDLAHKIVRCAKEDDCSNTDIEKTFDLLLKTAVNNHLKQEDLPKNILIISDMEFDGATTARWQFGYNQGSFATGMKTLFEEIADKYKAHGYVLPRLVFWNVNSRSNTVPLQENEMGVALVSGFSPTIATMVFSGKLDPEEVLIDKLNSDRYKPVEQAVTAVTK